MNNALNAEAILTHSTGTARVELHASPKTAAKWKRIWEAKGFTARLYFVTEGDDTLTGLEIAA